MFSDLSNIAEGVDTAFVVIFAVIFFFLITLTATLIFFIYRYNEKRNPVATPIEGNNTLEVVWTVIPLLLVLAMFWFGWTGWKPIYSDAPKDSLPITVTARMWHWSFKYGTGKQTDTLFVPQGKPVILDLQSLDVIHSFYVPAFRLKQDVIPGRKKTIWFIANSPGVYDIFCAEYCGLQHSSMLSSVKVLPEQDFTAWYADTTAAPAPAEEVMTPAIAGRNTFQRVGCVACHAVDGSTLVGPHLNGIFGSEVTVVTNGQERTVTVDENYIRRSILTPNADVVKGFNANLMQSFSGIVTDDEINDLTEYIKSMKDK
jgi:cytochrome c oxidase subunit 2